MQHKVQVAQAQGQRGGSGRAKIKIKRKTTARRTTYICASASSPKKVRTSALALAFF
jgi:hypothetical protein